MYEDMNSIYVVSNERTVFILFFPSLLHIYYFIRRNLSHIQTFMQHNRNNNNNNNNTLLKVQYPRSSVDYTNYSKEKY